MQRQTQRRNGTTLLEDIQLKSAAVALGDALQDLQPVAVPRLLLGGFLRCFGGIALGLAAVLHPQHIGLPQCFPLDLDIAVAAAGLLARLNGIVQQIGKQPAQFIVVQLQSLAVLEDALGFDAKIPGGVGLNGQNHVDDGRTAKGDELCAPGAAAAAVQQCSGFLHLLIVQHALDGLDLVVVVVPDPGCLLKLLCCQKVVLVGVLHFQLQSLQLCLLDPEIVLSEKVKVLLDHQDQQQKLKCLETQQLCSGKMVPVQIRKTDLEAKVSGYGKENGAKVSDPVSVPFEPQYNGDAYIYQEHFVQSQNLSNQSIHRVAVHVRHAESEKPALHGEYGQFSDQSGDDQDPQQNQPLFDAFLAEPQPAAQQKQGIKGGNDGPSLGKTHAEHQDSMLQD